LTVKMAHVLGKMGSQHALLVHGMDGLDEITTTAPTQVSEWRNGGVRTFILEPETMGLRRADPKELAGGTPEENAQITLKILQGEKGPKRDIVLLNAAAALIAAGKVKDFREGMKIAADAIDSSSALRKLEVLRDATRG
jgi:anthranilate phosphoribosyltransferase